MLFLLVVLLCSPLVSAQTSEMSIKIDGDEHSHITITVENPPNIAELRSIINEPKVREIYQQQIGNVFEDVENLGLSVDSGVFVVEFDSSISEVDNDGWLIERRDFQGNIEAVSKLKIVLPPDMVLADSNPSPDRSSENVFEWDGVDFIPEVRYERAPALIEKEVEVTVDQKEDQSYEAEFPANKLALTIIILIVLIVSSYAYWKKRK